MKIFNIGLGIMLGLAFPLFGQQSRIIYKPGLNDAKIRATGTGNTTGNIANLSVHNPSSNPVSVELKSMYIPGDGKYQPYIVPYKTTITVNPNATANIPLFGYCADIYRPPVPEGESMPPLDSWFEIDELEQGWTPQTTQGWRNLPPSTALTATIPGTESPIAHSIDGERYPDELAPVLLSALENIIQGYDSLKSKNLITTPFSGNPEKERESVIQQTFWVYASLVTGTEYTKESFKGKMITQFEQNKGVSFKEASPAIVSTLQKGVDDFWSTFELVGTEAKVISNTGTGTQLTPATQGQSLGDIQPKRDSISPPPSLGAEGFATGDSVSIQQDRQTLAHEAAHTKQAVNPAVPVANEDGSIKESTKAIPSCECKKFKATLECNRGLQRTISMENDFSKSSEIAISSDASFDKPKDVRKPEEFTLSLKDISLECACGETTCKELSAEKGKKDKPKFKVTLSSYKGVSLGDGTKSTISADTGHSFDFKATEASKDVEINFRIDVYCAAESCRAAYCKSSFSFKFSD